MSIFNKSRCYNGGKKHKFIPIYNEERNPPLGIKNIGWHYDSINIIKELTSYKKHMLNQYVNGVVKQ